MLVWLPEQGFNLTTYKHTAVYIPDRVFSDPRFCYCNLEKASPTDEKCTFCGDPIMKLIQQSVEQGKVLPQLLGDTYEIVKSKSGLEVGLQSSSGFVPFSDTNFPDFSRTQIDFSRALKFTLTPTLPRSQC